MKDYHTVFIMFIKDKKNSFVLKKGNVSKILINFLKFSFKNDRNLRESCSLLYRLRLPHQSSLEFVNETATPLD
jgi:hypothetical protein